MSDRAHIRRLRRALVKLQQARNYQRTATRMVQEAERELKAAVEAATPRQPGPSDGEQVAA